ncbi:MAG: hypothetical protein AVDCRST_MAG26-1430, partial [uncultured Chloroflexia bacterium]
CRRALYSRQRAAGQHILSFWPQGEGRTTFPFGLPGTRGPMGEHGMA